MGHSESSDNFLCFAGRFLLSSMIRVAAGTAPDFLAKRRASAPLSSFLRFFFFIKLAQLLTVVISPTARHAWSMASLVYANAPASEFAMWIRPNGWRPISHGDSPAGHSGS